MNLFSDILEGVGIISLLSLGSGIGCYFLLNSKKNYKIPLTVIQKAIDFRLPIQETKFGMEFIIEEVKINFDDFRANIDCKIRVTLPIIKRVLNLNIKASGQPEYDNGKIYIKNLVLGDKQILEQIDNDIEKTIIENKEDNNSGITGKISGWLSSAKKSFSIGMEKEKLLSIITSVLSTFLNHFAIYELSDSKIEKVVRKKLLYIKTEPDGILIKLK